MSREIFRGYAFIVGAMKSGTSTLHALLKQHPSICTGTKKELNFFSKRATQDPENYERKAFPDLDKYTHMYTLDSSPNYTKVTTNPHTMARIAGMPGYKRLLYIMRNPVERTESHLTHTKAQGRAVDAAAVQHALNTSQYAMQLDAIAAAGLLPDLLLLDFKELTENPVGLCNRVFAFMDLEPITVELDRVHNPRRLEGKLTTPDEDARYTELLRPGVQDLIERYSFEPARNWGIV